MRSEIIISSSQTLSYSPIPSNYCLHELSFFALQRCIEASSWMNLSPHDSLHLASAGQSDTSVNTELSFCCQQQKPQITIRYSLENLFIINASDSPPCLGRQSFLTHCTHRKAPAMHCDKFTVFSDSASLLCSLLLPPAFPTSFSLPLPSTQCVFTPLSLGLCTCVSLIHSSSSFLVFPISMCVFLQPYLSIPDN